MQASQVPRTTLEPSDQSSLSQYNDDNTTCATNVADTPKFNNNNNIDTNISNTISNNGSGTYNNSSNTNETKNVNNTFMLEFNDLVSSMNNMGQSNQSDDTGTVMGFPAEPQDYGFLDPLSPSSDTGCDWVDKHVFQFDSLSMAKEG